jgi:hypothetical protein
MRPGLAGLLVTCTVLTACRDPLPPVRYVTEKAIIATDFDEEICPSQLEDLDDHIRFVEDILGSPSDEKIEIYVYGERPPNCDGLGCYRYGEDIIETHWSEVDHEVVHAVEARFVDDPRAFWSEGIAVSLEDNGTHEGPTSVLSNVGASDYRGLDYSTAGHFVRWLLENEDPTLIRRMLKGESTDVVYGRTIEALAEAYEVERPYAYPPWFPCDHPALPSTEEGRWAETIDVSCEHPDGTSGENYRRSVVRSVELEAGTYTLETIGGSGTRIVGCQMDAWEEEPPSMANGDVPNEVEMSQTAVGVLFESGTVHEVELTAGTYKVVVATLELREEVSVELRRVGG